MNYNQIQAYSGFWSGAAVMISVHNMFLSFFLYKARQTNISNILKILFNFGNALRIGATWGTYMTPQMATLLQCQALLYSASVGNLLIRISLASFLLWRLKQVNSSKVDDWVGSILLFLRAGFGISQFALQRPTTVLIPDQNVVICSPNAFTNIIYVGIGIAIDFLIDIYVTVRLIQVLRKANKNAAQISSNMGHRSKRSLFTAVMYWNFLRLFVAFLVHLAPILNATIGDEVMAITYIDVVNIILSYVITVDAEIVRVIEGKEKKKGSSTGTGTDKSSKSIRSPRTPYTPPHYGSGLPKYSPHDNENYSHIDDGKIAVVSMKRMSFFEWANVVVGNRLRRDDNDDEYDENEEIEEIIDGSSKGSREDIEKGFSQDRRNSNFSGTTSTTETSTLDENPDIITN